MFKKIIEKEIFNQEDEALNFSLLKTALYIVSILLIIIIAPFIFFLIGLGLYNFLEIIF